MATHNITKIAAVPGKQDILITREFNAPRELVFRAYTDPQLYTRWAGPGEIKMTIETFEPKFGGRYRYIHKDKNGKEFAFHGVYHEVKSPEMIIDTVEFEGLPEKGHAALETVKFEPLPGGKTRVIAKSVFLSTEDRDGMIQADMQKGINESHERLDDLLESERKK
jgi:uncharacterized protein YndB with AHSA1/START domain